MNALNQQTSEAISERRAELAALMVEREFARQPELARRYGKAGREKCLQDASYHLAYLAQAIAADHQGLFINYIGWAKVMLAKRGVPAADLAGLLDSMQESLQQELVPACSRLAGDYLAGAIRELPQLPDDVPSFIVEGTPLAPLATEYLQALLRGDQHFASALIMERVRQGLPVRDLYLQVFQRCQHEIGRLWQINRINVAQEHYCTAATQLLMAQFYPQVFGAKRTRGILVATCVAGDLHELGARMVSDFFAMDGWQTHYLGANVPASGIVQTLVQLRADALAISATIAYHVQAVAELIAAVRRTPECAGVKILVGGYPFIVAPDLWRTVGADGSAVDALAASALLDHLVSQASPS